MKHILLLFILTAFVTQTQAQDMSLDKLAKIIEQESDTLQRQNGSFKIIYKEALMLCMTDENANRMRIISPITEIFKLDEDELKNALVANFHTALDVKYAISDDLLWAVFIHPLKELSEEQVKDAMLQVYSASVNFGTTYSSTNLIFPGVLNKDDSDKEKKDKEEKPLKKTKI